MKIQIDEQETIIRIGRVDDVAEISTTDTRYMTKLDKLVKNNPEEWKFVDQATLNGDVVEKFYECPVNLISFRAKKTTRTMTEEQKEAAAQRMKEYHASKEKLNDE